MAKNIAPWDQIYELSEGEINRERDVALGDDVVQEVIPLIPGVTMLDPSGNVVHVALHNGAYVNQSAFGAAYATKRLHESLAAGFLPIYECPHTTAHSSSLHGIGTSIPLVAGGVACGGAKQGCEHWHAVKAARQAESLAKYEKINKADRKIDIADAERLADLFATASGKGSKGRRVVDAE
ncbi:MAG: hypothetical protein E6Q97_38500 [Desulfurellales bacterium]|nr:MAG: hypothetical protein E6Q97_38500 [Desulfurellales bacterium]